MVELSEKKKGIEELLKKIPAEKCWAITAKILTSFFVMRGEKIIAPALGKDKGIIAPVMGAEKWIEINVKIFGDGSKILFPMFKEMFNVPVENAIDAAKLVWVAARLMFGPEWEMKYVEKSPERVVFKWTKCPWMERYKEFDADPAFTRCDITHQVIIKEGLKVINPKLTFKITKAIPRGDPYCEDVYEFKED